MRLLTRLAPILLAAGSSVGLFALNPLPSNFTNCILSTGSGTTCSIPSGTYDVTSTLTVERSNITIEGSSITGTTLRRASASLQAMIVPASGVGGVTIAYLTIDGNRYDSSLGINCLAANQGWGEIDWRVFVSGTRTYDESQTGIVTIHDVAIINAPADGVHLGGYASGGASTISYSFIGTDSSTSHTPSYATRGTGLVLWGTSAGSYYAHYYYSGTAGLSVFGSNQIIYGNEFFQNRYEASDGSAGGGQLYLEGPIYTSYATATSVARNTINGNNWTTPSSGTLNGCSVSNPNNNGVAGIEMSGYYHGIYNNEISQHSGDGISIGGGNEAGSITITTNNPWVPGDTPQYISYNGHFGIWVWGTNQNSGDPNQHNVQGIELDQLYMANNSAHDVWFDYNVVGVGGAPNSAVGFSTTGTHHMCGTSGWSGSSSPPPPYITNPGTYNGTPSNSSCP